MADTENEFSYGFVDTRRHPKGQSEAVPLAGTGTARAGAANISSVAELRARLSTANGAYYTVSRLNTMTKNDMVYAVRQSDEAAGIK